MASRWTPDGWIPTDAATDGGTRQVKLTCPHCGSSADCSCRLREDDLHPDDRELIHGAAVHRITRADRELFGTGRREYCWRCGESH